MPQWIHDRAKRIMESTKEQYGKEKGEQVAFALATQQAHATGKSPKKWHGKPFGTPEGKREAKDKYDEPSKMQKSADRDDAREELDPQTLEALRAYYGVRGRDIAGHATRGALGSGAASAALSGLGTHSAEGALAGLAAGGALGGLYGLGEGVYDKIKTERALKRGELPDFSPSLAREVLLPSLAAGGTVGLVTQGITDDSDVAVRNALLSGGITGLAGLLRYGLMRKAMRDQERELAKAGSLGYRGSLEEQILPAILHPSRRDFEKAAGVFSALLEKVRGKRERKPNVYELQPSEGPSGIGAPVSSGMGITQLGSYRKLAEALMTPQGPIVVGAGAPPAVLPPAAAPTAPVLIPVSMSAETTPLTPPAGPPIPPPLPVASVAPGVTQTPMVAGPPRQPPAPQAPKAPPPVTQSAAGQAQEPTQQATPPKAPPAEPAPPPKPEKSTLAPKVTVQVSGGATKTSGLRAPRPWEEKRANGEDEGQGTVPPAEDLEQEVIQFLAENENPDDEQLHQWAESKGYNVPAVERAIYRLATKFVQFADDGRAGEKGVTFDDVDPKQLAMGVEVEKEHTPDEETARRIALDHLAEMPDYYTRLKEMEASGEKNARARMLAGLTEEFGEPLMLKLKKVIGTRFRGMSAAQISEALGKMSRGEPLHVNLPAAKAQGADFLSRWHGTRDVGKPFRYAGPESVAERTTSMIPLSKEVTAGLVPLVPHFLGALDTIIKAGGPR